jgi:lambda family phage portal protein
MAARFSASGKRIGRPPKAPQPEQTAVAQTVQKFSARYDAAGQGRRLAGWTPPSSGPNVAMAGLQTIRNRSHDAVRNDWSAESATQKWATNLIGIAITPRFKRLAKARKAVITDLWNDFVKRADADCVLDMYGMQTLAVRSWLEAGEVFARRRARFLDEDGLIVPMQVQLLEADMVPLMDADSWKGLPAGNTIRSGIEFNKRGRRVAYWVYKQHPGDKGFMGMIEPDALVRVAASDMIHMFEPKRPGQLRGVSALAPVLVKQRNAVDYEDATLERQKLANLFVATVSRTLPPLDPNDPNNGALTGTAYDTDGVNPEPLVPLRPGLVQELEDGQKMEWSNPPEAGTNYSDYMRTTHLGTAAGAGLPYELMSGDIREVSDRTLRVVINDFRRFAEQRQWQIIIPMFCQRVIEWFADAALLAGEITTGELADVVRVEHAPHGWEYIHPVQDPQGKRMEVEAGFRSRSSVIGARGDDPDAVDDERKADMDREKALGLWVDPLGATDPAAADDEEDADGIDNDEYSAPPNPTQAEAKAMHIAQLRRIEAETDALRARAALKPAPTDPLAEGRLQLQNRILDLLEPDGGQQ